MGSVDGIAGVLRTVLDSLGLRQGQQWWLDYVLMVVVLAIIIGFICGSVLFLVWLERKVSARIQRRMGPMMAGPLFMARKSMWLGGWLQTCADALKLLLKEDLTPGSVDRVVFIMAPALVLTASLMCYVVIPFAPGISVADLNVGVLYVLAVSSMTVLGIMMAGWSSNNKYSLLGGLRSVAQMISYELPMIFALLGPVLMAGSLSMQDIVKAQAATHWFIIPNLIGFLIFIIAGTAETNRPPFDLPEGESELVAGFVTEYSGMKFAMFFLAEFSNLFVVSAVATTLFLGGWSLPFVHFSSRSSPRWWAWWSSSSRPTASSPSSCGCAGPSPAFASTS